MDGCQLCIDIPLKKGKTTAGDTVHKNYHFQNGQNKKKEKYSKYTFSILRQKFIKMNKIIG